MILRSQIQFWIFLLFDIDVASIEVRGTTRSSLTGLPSQQKTDLISYLDLMLNFKMSVGSGSDAIFAC